MFCFAYTQDHCGDWENEPKPQDLLELHAGALGDNEHTRPYCRALLDLGLTQQQINNPDAAVATFRGLLDSDKSDVFGARDRLLCALMDSGNLAEARALIESKDPKERSARDWYSLALVEYIAWMVLQEEDASEEVACAALKVICFIIPCIFEPCATYASVYTMCVSRC